MISSTTLIIGAIVAIWAVINNMVAISMKKKKKSIPKCFHCESEDTLDVLHNSFVCTKCERVIDKGYIFRKHPEDYHALLRGKQYYKDFKLKRGKQNDHQK